MHTLQRKSSPGKCKAALQVKYYYKIPKGETKTRRYRGKYFVRCRRERWLIKLLSNSPPNTHTVEKRERAIVRRIYYCILPRLLSLVVYEPDRVDLLRIERCYYDYLNIDRLRNGVTKGRVNRLTKITRFLPYRRRLLPPVALENPMDQRKGQCVPQASHICI